ncbi:MAG: hypothetical protein ACRCY9_19120 [Phycicoccus sp.]
MRIAITGSFGAGKTTLARALSDALELPYREVPPMAGPLGLRAASAVECSTAELVELLVRRLMDRAAMEFDQPDVVSDGSLIHDWVFVRALLMHGPDPGPRMDADPTWQIDSLEPSRRAIHTRMRDLYDVVVHLPIEFPLAPGNRPVSERFRELSDIYLCRELDQVETPVRTVTGHLDDRVDHCLRLVRATTENTPVRSAG